MKRLIFNIDDFEKTICSHSDAFLTFLLHAKETKNENENENFEDFANTFLLKSNSNTATWQYGDARRLALFYETLSCCEEREVYLQHIEEKWRRRRICFNALEMVRPNLHTSSAPFASITNVYPRGNFNDLLDAAAVRLFEKKIQLKHPLLLEMDNQVEDENVRKLLFFLSGGRGESLDIFLKKLFEEAARRQQATSAQSREAFFLSLISRALGARRTAGSLREQLPPPVARLWRAFNATHTSAAATDVGSALTVGARAFEKHAHRSHDNYWNALSRSAAAALQATQPHAFYALFVAHASLLAARRNFRANVDAALALRALLLDCAWLNVHCLPPYDIATLELRNSSFYGARWTQRIADAANAPPPLRLDAAKWEFRGFLEPPQVDGHAQGWRH